MLVMMMIEAAATGLLLYVVNDRLLVRVVRNEMEILNVCVNPAYWCQLELYFS